MSNINPESLVDHLHEIAQGRRDAFHAFHAQTSAPLFAHALRLLGDRSLAEDVLQETYMRIWRYSASFDATRAAPMTWAIQILRNRICDFKSAQAAAAQCTLDDREAVAVPCDEARDDEPREHDASYDAEEDSAAFERLHACFAELEGRYRQALYLSFNHGLSHAEIAERLGIALGTTKSLIRRALLDLRAQLDAQPEPAHFHRHTHFSTQGAAR